MEEIAPHVLIETVFPGVTLGAVSWPHGQVLIDAPIRSDDARSWRAMLHNVGSSGERLLVNLDAHFDRTLGTRGMEFTVIGHEKMAQVFRNRPVTFKTQSIESGAEWELYSNLGSIRWSPPDITFTQQMQIHWNGAPLLLEYHPGPASGATWAVLPQQKVVFVGDAVAINQPPFLANANIPDWLVSLKKLQSPQYQDFLVVSGRGGLAAAADIYQQIALLEDISSNLDALAARNTPSEALEALIPGLVKHFPQPVTRQHMYTQRLRWGLRQYYARHYRAGGGEVTEE